ncbi:MAG: CoA-binding protein [Firmicutes bacterium]|nr:CoA-binding protein [Bacillota bacterium]
MNGLSDFFTPQSVAIVGASKTPGKIGNAIVKNMIQSGFTGKIYPINPKENEIEGLKCYPSISDIDGRLDLVAVAIPAAHTVQLAEECGQKGVKHLVVISAGFKEIGHEGMELEKQLVSTCHNYGMRLLGPNCIGVMDTHSGLNASFSGVYPTKGDIAFISQSGAMLVAILDWSKATGIGFSKVISLGNKADLTETHSIAIAADDPNTKVILCYIEDVADGEHFLDVVSKASKKKPIIILKSGTSQAGAQAASSHTGALAGSDVAYETAFRQCGVIRAHTMPALFDLGIAFSRQPVPKGKRVAVITNAGGPGIVATDTIENAGLAMARFDKETISKLRDSLPAEANIYNPVDVLGDAKADRYSFSLEKALSDEGVDSALVLVCPTAVTDSVNTAREVTRVHRIYPGKPVFAAYMGGETLKEGSKVLEQEGVPSFIFPEPAIHALAGMSRYAELQQRFEDEKYESKQETDIKGVKQIFNSVRDDGRLVLLGNETAQVAKAFGIPAAPVELAESPDEAAKLADEMGYPVVLKVASPKILHKTDVGGVKINLNGPNEVRKGFVEINENIQRYLPDVVIHGIEVQRMMPKGVELIVGMSRDVQFGPLIAFGLGGIYVNLLKDVSFRLARDLTEKEIESMIRETKAYTLLRGYRGDKPADIKGVTNLIDRVARLAIEFPEITEMDINPVFAYPDGASALDIKITIS